MDNQKRSLVYICSPLAGDIPSNMERAKKYSRFAVMEDVIPITPHLLFPQYMNEDIPEERELGMFMGLVLLCFCSELWYFGETISEGMRKEIVKAWELGIPVRHFSEDCMEVSVID